MKHLRERLGMGDMGELLVQGVKALHLEVTAFAKSSKGTDSERTAKKVIGFVIAAGRAAMKDANRKVPSQ